MYGTESENLKTKQKLIKWWKGTHACSHFTDNFINALFFLQALVLPQAIATPTGGVILDIFERLRCDIGLGYIILFLVTSVYFVLSGIFVFNIKRAK